MVEQGEELLSETLRLARTARERIGAIDGLSVTGSEIVDQGFAFEVDPLVLSIDVRDLGVTGYQVAELARDRHQVNFGAADTFRLNARLTHADDQTSVDILVDTLSRLPQEAAGMDCSGQVELPDARGLELETAMRPRDAFFADAEQVSAEQAVRRIAAEMVTPYPPGVPVLAPGEVITSQALDYLRSAVAAGVLIPEAADPSVNSVRVVRREAELRSGGQWHS
jgi:arginine/lysine/ornithine decarboxylase